MATVETSRPAEDRCYPCLMTADPAAPPSESIVRTEHWRVAHAFDTTLAGWLVIVSVPHLTRLAELGPAAGAELGDLVRRLSIALEQVVGCDKTYVMQFSEADGFGHLHCHLVPRMPDQPAALRGPRVFGYLGATEAERLTSTQRDGVSAEIATALASIR